MGGLLWLRICVISVSRCVDSGSGVSDWCRGFILWFVWVVVSLLDLDLTRQAGDDDSGVFGWFACLFVLLGQYVARDFSSLG